MALEQPPFAIDDPSLAYSAELTRRALASNQDVGVIGVGDLKVTAVGGGNHTVNIAAGEIWMPGTGVISGPLGVSAPQIVGQGKYYAYNNASINIDILGPHPADGTFARNDLIVASIRDNNYDSGGFIDWLIQPIIGTPSGSPALPTIPPSSVVLAQINVPALATTIPNSRITDLRPRQGQVKERMSVYLAGAVPAVASFVPTTIKFDTVNSDPTGNYSTSTGLWTVPVSGIYLVDSCVVLGTPGGTGQVVIEVGKNAVTTFRVGDQITVSAAWPNPGVSIGAQISCVAGDTLSINITQTTGVNISVFNGTPYVWWDTHLLSRT